MMSLLKLERRPTSPARLGRFALAGVFIAVAIVFGAKWFVAADYMAITKGDYVQSKDNSSVGTVMSVNDGVVTYRTWKGPIRKQKVFELRELVDKPESVSGSIF